MRHEDGSGALALLVVVAIVAALAVVVIAANDRSSGGPTAVRDRPRDALISACKTENGLLKSFPASPSYTLTYTSDGTTFTVTSNKAGCS